MKKIIIGIVVLAVLLAGVALAQVPLTYTKTATKFQIDNIDIAPTVKGCSTTYSFIDDKGEVVKSKTLYLDCKPIPGIANAIKYVTAQIGLAESKVIPDLPDITK